MGLSGLFLTLCLGAFGFQDSFEYPNGDMGAPNWFAESVAWETHDGRMTFEGGNRGFAILDAAPFGRALTLEATMTVQERAGGEWAIAGIGVRWDNANFWQLALVEAPENKDRAHIVELAEMKDGAWLAQNNEATRLPVAAYATEGFSWEYGRPYRFKLALTPAQIEGFILEQDGTVRAHIAYTLTEKAVRTGKPVLVAGQFATAFDDVTAEVSETAETLAPKPFPPYTAPGYGEIQGPGTGFFYPVERDGRWWLIDPNGQGFYMLGADHINYNVHWCEKLGYAPYAKNVAEKYGSESAWADSTAQRLSDWGFNTLPANHSGALRYRRFPHIQFLSMGSSFAAMDNICPITTWTGFPNVFSPKWPRHCAIYARNACLENQGDPWLIGYFLDNELEWFGKNYTPWGLFDETWKKPRGHTAKQAWVDFLKTRLTGPEEFEALWGVPVAGFDALLQNIEPQPPRNERARALAEEWVREIAERYFRTCREAILAQDPHHLILGCRFAGAAPDIWDIAGRYCDIVSFNIYPRIDVDRGVPESVFQQIDGWHQKAQKPMMVTEWSFPALDSGLPCVHGAGMRVDTQTQRTACFTHFQSFLLQLPYMVGSNFFMWADEPALGISSTFPEDSNYGLVNEKDEPYAEITKAARLLHANAFGMHRSSAPYQPCAARPMPKWLTDLPESVLPLPAGPLRFQAGGLRLEGPVDTHAWRLKYGETVLADLFALVHQDVPGPAWVPAEISRVTRVLQNARITMVDMNMERLTGPAVGAAEPQARKYQSGWRFWIPRNGSEWIAAQCLWMQNSDETPWTLAEVYPYLPPTLGGDPERIITLPDAVPNYYLRGAAWADTGLNLGVGCWYADGAAFECSFWKRPQEGLHPDLRQVLNTPLEPGQRLEINGPLAFFFPVKGASVTAFGEATQTLEKEIR